MKFRYSLSKYVNKIKAGQYNNYDASCKLIGNIQFNRK